ncbi:MAG TPA: hypothetical protein VGH27_15985 [Streptosporangiaceae bacterium]
MRRDSQVLICPDCQSGRDWSADLDRCARCGTVRLVRRLGEAECKDCGHIQDPAAPAASPSGKPTAPPSSLADEVARALDRVLGASRR